MCSVEVQNQLADALADALADVGRRLSYNMEVLVGACAHPDVDVEALVGLQVVHKQRGQWLAEQVFTGCLRCCLDREETLAIGDHECWRASSSLLETHLRLPDPNRLLVEAMINEFECAFRQRFGELMMHTPPLPNTLQ